MAFWNEATLEPKRKFKFVIDFGTVAGASLPRFIVKKCDKPNFEIAQATHDFLGHKFHYPGRVSWKEITAAVIDPAGSSQLGVTDVSKAIYEVLIASGYQSPTDAGSSLTGNNTSVTTLAKGKATNQFNQIKIQQLDAEGNALETWTLYNAWIKIVNFGSLEYNSDDINEITFTFVYDWASIQVGNTVLGQ